ncbi:MAG TPA: alpha/beta hydrolase family protein [Bacteroidota bacterium]|nr:alpha/beta hydrolase family protein [Bacteroidota bacterium]
MIPWRSLTMPLIIFLFVRLCLFQTMQAQPIGVSDSTYQTIGIKNNLPIFSQNLSHRLTFPYSWLSGNFKDFKEWKKDARAKVKECLLTPPPSAPFHPTILAEQDRGTYLARKIVFNISADSRILGYLLIPKGQKLHPAVLLLHDHGARFDIGKEKVIEPFGDTTRRLTSAHEWVEKYYGGRFIGDELAKRGYVCFATDALNWSDRGGAGIDGQQAVASNLFNLGMSFAGLIAWDDMRAAEFLASQPEVDSTRIVAMGFSFGSFRAWQVAALSDHIAGCVAVCWMSTIKCQMAQGSNQTRGASAFTMTHPNLSNYLDYADVASIACPKPMLFYNGTQDHLFPVAAVEDAYTTLHQVWKSQYAEQNLETRFWNTGHIFNQEMQKAAFEWLDNKFLTH